ncbi:MAG TPA: flavodoxin family protein, partial [Candidatus Binatia bacterium]|nr:flavodoxin family protein [Candidatus Binatia bacterium]
MKIVGISGSPRYQATEHILEESLKLLAEKGYETKLWTVRGKWVDYCAHCDYCLTNKECVVQDDLQELYALLAEANGIIFASPVYNGGVSAQIKAVMDRMRAAVA